MSSKRYSIWLKRRLFPRSLKFTREGKIYVAVTLGVGFAAINTGNNLLFLVLGLMLSLIIASGILAELSLRGIEVRRCLPARAEADVPFAVKLLIENHKRWASSFGIELGDEIDGQLTDKRCFFLRVKPKETRSITYHCHIAERGLHSFQEVHISTQFPFGLFKKGRFQELVGELIAHPRRVAVDLPLLRDFAGLGANAAYLPGPGQDFGELRAWVPGDDPRRIHWPATARTGQLFVSITDADASGEVEIVLDAALRSALANARAEVEMNIRLAAAFIRLLTQQGCLVSLVTSGSPRFKAHDQTTAIPLLDHLALLDPQKIPHSRPPLASTGRAILLGPQASNRGSIEWRKSVAAQVAVGERR